MVRIVPKKELTKGTIEKVNKDSIMLSVTMNKSRIGETDRVILKSEEVDFTTLEKGQTVKVWVYDEGVRLSNPPQVSAKKIEVIK
jgi:hypothetical protein